MTFEKTGSFWSLPFYKKAWANLKYWFKGLWMFFKVLLNYKESVIGNDLDVFSAWSLCFALQEARMGKMYRYSPLTNKSSMEES